MYLTYILQEGSGRITNQLPFFANHLHSQCFALSLLITLKCNDKIPEILWRPQGYLTGVYGYRYDI